MIGFTDTLAKWWAPRRRAERLVHARIDAQRGEGHIAPADEAWLERRLKADPALKAYADEQAALQDFLRPLASPRAPEGFAARVLHAASVRSEAHMPDLAPPPPKRNHEAGRLHWGWAVGSAVAAGLVVAVALRLPDRPPPVPSAGLEVSGQATALVDQPDFLIRAPGVGAAKARAQIVALLKRHEGGSPIDDGRALQVRLPRSELVPVMQDLARMGSFKVTPVRDGPLPPAAQTVVLRFALD